MLQHATEITRVDHIASKGFIIHSALFCSDQWELWPCLESLNLFSMIFTFFLSHFPEPFFRRCVCQVWLGCEKATRNHITNKIVVNALLLCSLRHRGGPKQAQFPIFGNLRHPMETSACILTLHVEKLRLRENECSVLCCSVLGLFGYSRTTRHLKWDTQVVYIYSLVWLAFLSSCLSQLNNMRKQVENLLAEMYMGSPGESRE